MGEQEEGVKPDQIAECSQCAMPFMRRTTLHRVCSPLCAVRSVRAQKKAERADTKRRKEAAKTRSQWLKEAQEVVNRYVRLRDAKLGCVSCDKPATWGGQWHASHFRSVGAASAVRFNLWNIHKACSICNNWKSGNLSEYEPRLRERIGAEKVDWLRTQNQRADFQIEYLKRLKVVFARRVKRMEKRL